MKKVTSWAAIIAVPTAVTGFYGMNVPYPGFAQHSGFIASVVLLVVLSGGLYLLFKHLDFDVLCSHAETVSAMHDAEHRALQGRVT